VAGVLGASLLGGLLVGGEVPAEQWEAVISVPLYLARLNRLEILFAAAGRRRTSAIVDL
jgi:hypothetical protein